jgi:trk system potassium uptake protein
MPKQEFAVIGLGRFGSNVALTLESNGYAVLGIDANPELVQKYAHQLTQAVVLDSTNSEALKAVDISSFDTVVVAIGTDFENSIMTTVALKELGVKRVIAKAPNERQKSVLLRIGADQVIRPEHEAGKRLAESMIAPHMLEHFGLGPDTDYGIAEFIVPHSLTCQSLRQTNIRQRYGLNVLVIKRGKQILVSPPAETILQPEDILIVLGHDGDIERFSRA